ncbi:protein phosphatase 1 regulatory subunit 14A-like isoform X2 [Watersipora subatra]|uniref:protein phosphatase 1 regulatory subunit 14A-like isoform X2 n=1 Tax=Watersipora subatra TaxID=2589382 RepID=UPI00355C6FD3
MASARSPPAATAVSFTENKNNGTDLSVEDVKQQEQKTKFLTMKYGQNQIRLIQKRLKIEFWIDAELKTLYSIDESSGETYPCDVDLDEILELEDREERKQFLLDFVDEILKRLDTL